MKLNMEQNKIPNRLFVIGNGFDLNIGRNTRYSDFAKSEFWPKDLMSNLYEHLNQKSKIERWFDLEGELANYVAGWSQPYMSGYQGAIPEIAKKDEQDFNIIVEAMISYLISEEKNVTPKDSSLAAKVFWLRSK